MIRSFKHRGLKELFETGRSRRIPIDLQRRAIRRLDTLDSAGALATLNIPGFEFHRLHGKPTRYSIHINGPFCLTFEWDSGDAIRVDLEQYH